MGRNGGVISFYLLPSQHMLIGELHIPGRGATRGAFMDAMVIQFSIPGSIIFYYYYFKCKAYFT